MYSFRSVLSHASFPVGDRARLGITDNLVRLSVGLEDVDDIIADLDQALRSTVSVFFVAFGMKWQYMAHSTTSRGERMNLLLWLIRK